jgi:glycosyltransferase involved in cell wall biosynthesis
MEFDFNTVVIKSSRRVVQKKEVDVIIPTIGRKEYLYDVLKDLSTQSILPKNVILVEQNPDSNSVSELDFIKTENWPFNIKHIFIHRTGVCHARNLALKLVESEWTFFGDDDLRFDDQLIERALENIEKLGVKAINTICLQPGEKQTYFKTSQTPIFGSGTSFVKSDLLTYLHFDLRFEFGYGEDSDFGMQIRNNGEDVVFISDVLITHLKAPFGGYRIQHKNNWDNETYKPKPSPTIMLFNQKYLTKHQILGYKLLLFIKFYKHQSIKNPFRYISEMKKKWNSSLYWSQQLGIMENA